VSHRWITGWKLASDDRERLLAQVSPLFPDIVADHVTLRTGTDEATPLPVERGGEILGEASDGRGVQALVVEIGGTMRRADGATYHITWSLDRSAGRRARESDDVIARHGWRALARPLSVALTPARRLWDTA
jgi:hypothetical protein